ncbi:5-methylcytosine-specific restriction endonuclease McrA [Agromyces sp. 3263]|uniref:HNH endonuclease n=1 Tax=Agromyces sp. 3263 TaxID=2817750 RepID=UPI00285E29E1|nr:HNH endonuclease [Agromyces sp. 3263]MDR6907519.1 5-methylcytosine-specific restriction endonuclease McrA [Agromyces sp. 3263]
MPKENGKRRRRMAVKSAREEAAAVLEQWRSELDLRPVGTRAEYMAAARELGTHSRAEAIALLRSTSHCRYCKTPLDTFNCVQDHIVPVALGGSDAIENIQIICWECNNAKGNRTDYVYEGTEPRPLSPLPQRQGWWD